MRFSRLRSLSAVVASTTALVLTGVVCAAFAGDSRTVSPKAKEVVTRFPKAIQDLPGELELYGTITAVDKKGIVLAVNNVDKQYPGNQITAGQPYFGAVKKDDPEAWLAKKTVRLLWREDGFDGEKYKKLYEENKKNYKTKQFLRVGVTWSKKGSGLTVKGATWFGGPGKRGGPKAGA
jgi:hypothetical protein